MEELEWPDYLDEETGIFRYYGDNREPGRELNDTKKKGNKILETAFALLNEGVHLEDMPPFFIFKKTGVGRDIQFLGLAAPGNPKISPDRDLVAFWRTVKEKRFQNYEAYFTILDTGEKPITQEWLVSLIEDHDNNLQYAPKVWRNYIEKVEEYCANLCSQLKLFRDRLQEADAAWRAHAEALSQTISADTASFDAGTHRE